MVKIRTENFSLAQICRSGQCFRMSELGDHTYRIIAEDRYLEVRQQGNECSFDCDEAQYHDYWKQYFDLERDYGAYIRQINPNDPYLNNAVRFGSGIRILQQDLWEMIVSFLISQQNNIVRIRRCIENICACYGKPCMNARGEVYYAFPKPETLAVLADDDLKACNLGYRSRYVVRAAQSVLAPDGIDLDSVSGMSYKKAKEELLRLFGVGEKVADCICLFALHHLQAFPVDTHIHQAMEAHYKRGFPNRRYRGFQGVMQQYIFYYELLGRGRQDVWEEKEACTVRENV